MMTGFRHSPVNGLIDSERPPSSRRLIPVAAAIAARRCGQTGACWGAASAPPAAGIWSLSNLDCNGMSQQETNIRADVHPITQGLSVKAVNTFGGVNSDVAAGMDWLSPFLPVGFYYKAFHTPGRLFPFYERRMRDMAGLGSVNPKKLLEHTPKRYDFCDVLVVGSGPAGLSAAVTAMRCSGLLVESPIGRSFAIKWHVTGARTLHADLLARAEGLKNLKLRTSTSRRATCRPLDRLTIRPG
jgi:sarcosine oxidase subunit alpha